MGYETPAPESAFDGPAMAISYKQSDSVQRMLALIAEFYCEFDRVIPALRHVDRDAENQSQE